VLELVMSEKVYCKDCKWYQSGFNAGMSVVILIGEECCSPKNKKQVHNHRTKYTILKRKPKSLNKDNNCKYYRHQWWKFWIK
jgi:hypothetical protein